MSERGSDESGLTSGDPLAPGAEAPRHESGLPAPPPARPPEQPFGGYASPPPPGAVAGGAAYAQVPAPAAGQYTLAGWWSRVGAALIDGVIVAVGALLILLLFSSVFSVGFFASDEAGVAGLIVGLLLSFVAIAIVALLYAPLMMARTNGKTLGRMALGIRVVRASGEPMTFGWAMLREVAVKSLLFGAAGSITLGVANLLDVLWPLWDDENRALHDFLVDTRTVVD
jgi:uncharacterized RDD family membrane protein YckC